MTKHKGGLFVQNRGLYKDDVFQKQQVLNINLLLGCLAFNDTFLHIRVSFIGYWPIV